MGTSKGSGNKYKVGGLIINGTEVLATAAEINTGCDGITATAAELNKIADQSASYHIPYTHRINVTATSGVSGEQDSGSVITARDTITDAYLYVRSAAVAGTQTIDVGLNSTTSGDADGFLNDISVASTGLVRPAITSATSGTWGRFISACTYGAYLADISLGATSSGSGMVNRKAHAGNSSIVYGVSWTAGSTTWTSSFDADIVLVGYRSV
jgi:hypothetical protein